MLAKINKPEEEKSNLAGILSGLGTAAAIGAAPFTAGTSLAALAAAGGIGGTAGGLVGGAVDMAQNSSKGVSQDVPYAGQSAVQRRMERKNGNPLDLVPAAASLAGRAFGGPSGYSDPMDREGQALFRRLNSR